MVTGKSILKSIKDSYEARVGEITTNIVLAAQSPSSIPDHFDFTGDIKEQIEELDRVLSLVETTERLIEGIKDE